MVKEYIEALCNEINKVFEENEISIDSFYSDLYFLNFESNQANAVFSGGYPKIICSMETNYICDDKYDEYSVDISGDKQVKKIDYSKGLLINPVFMITILSNESEQIAKIEDVLLDAFSSETDLYVKYENNDTVCISLKKSENKSVVRKTINRYKTLTFFSSVIYLETTNVGMAFNVNYHPAKVAFDRLLQFDVLEKYIAYGDLSSFFYEKLPFQIIEKKDKYVPSDEEKRIESNYLITKEISESMINTTELLDSEHSNIFYAKKLHEIMIYNRCVKLEDAINIFNSNKEGYSKQLQKHNESTAAKQEKRIKKLKDKDFEDRQKQDAEKNRNSIIESKGDPEINRYIDSVIKNMRSIIGDDIDIYGGNTYMNYYKKNDDGSLVYPYIKFDTRSDFLAYTEFDFMRFKLYHTQNESLKDYVFDYYYYLPMALKISIQICFDDTCKDKAGVIADQIMKAYEKGVVLHINMPNDKNTNSMLYLKIDDKYNKISNQDSYKRIDFCKQIIVYYSLNYDMEGLLTNSRLQFSLLKRAGFYYLIRERLNKAIDLINNDYKRCFNGEETNNLDKKNGEKYCTLKSLYNNHQFISRSAFNEGLSNIVSIFPELYNHYINGHTIDVIISDIQSKREKLFSLYSSLCDELGIPNKEMVLVPFSSYRNDLKCYSSFFICNDFTIINDIFLESVERKIAEEEIAKAKYKAQKEKEVFDKMYEKIEARKRSREYHQSLYQEYPQYEDSSGPGFVETTSAVVVGNAISSIIENKRRKHQKFDYRGTSSCQIGKIDEKAFTKGARHTNCLMCPISSKCASYE